MAAANESRVISGIISLVILVGGFLITNSIEKQDKAQDALIERIEKLEDRDRSNNATIEVLKFQVAGLSGELKDTNVTLKEINSKLTLTLMGK